MSLDLLLTELTDQIAALTPAQRRRLLQRLRVAGLLESLDGEDADRDRLTVAPALGGGRSGRASTKKQAMATKTAPTMVLPLKPPPPTQAQPAPEGYRSAVRGKVVVASSTTAPEPAPSDMPPLPGQAPENPILVVFDGGSRGNPGDGYGSYALGWPGRPAQVVRLRFGEQVTNNEAEYDTLIAGLTAILEKLREQKADPATARVDIRGDSLLVINQVLGQWQCKEPRMHTRRDQVRRLLAQLGSWQLTHHDREESVRILGH